MGKGSGSYQWLPFSCPDVTDPPGKRGCHALQPQIIQQFGKLFIPGFFTLPGDGQILRLIFQDSKPVELELYGMNRLLLDVIADILFWSFSVASDKGDLIKIDDHLLMIRRNLDIGWNSSEL